MTTWQRHEGVLWRRSGSRRLVRCPGTDELIVIDGGGSAAWDLLDQPTPEEVLLDELSRGFGIHRSQVAAEVTTFLEELRSVGAVVRT